MGPVVMWWAYSAPPPPVEIGLTDLPKSGGAMAPSEPSAPTVLQRNETHFGTYYANKHRITFIQG